MDNEQMINQLENLAGQAFRSWGVADDLSKESLHAQAYAQCCTAITALNAPKPFIQIGNHIIRRDDVIRVEIKEANNYYNEPKHVRLYTRDVYGGESYGSTTNYEKFPYGSPEAKAVLAWFKDYAEVIVPCEVLDSVSEGNDTPIVEGSQFAAE